MSESVHHIIKSSRIAVRVVPHEGSRIASLVSIDTGVEFLAQPYQDRSNGPPSLSARFETGICAGIDECLPSVGPCGSLTEGGAIPDHGDFWQIPWQVKDVTQTTLTCFAQGFSRPIHFEKHIAVHDRFLEIHYRIENIGTDDVSLLYACHPLLAIDPDDHVCLPPEVNSLSLDYSRNARLGKRGKHVSWPITQGGHHLDIVESKQTGHAEMLYTSRLRSGQCGIFRSTIKQGVTLHFDPAQLPFLGVWLCYGGWPDTPCAPLQYAVALEPTFAPANTLTEAQETGLAKSICSHQSIEWLLKFEISDSNIPFEQFWPSSQRP
jgi:hypothetical protein